MTYSDILAVLEDRGQNYLKPLLFRLMRQEEETAEEKPAMNHPVPDWIRWQIGV